MRKALTAPAAALVAALTLGASAVAATSAFAAGIPAAASQERTDRAGLRLSAGAVAPGDEVRLTLTAPGGATGLAVFSQAVDGTAFRPAGPGAWTALVKVKDVRDGAYSVTVTGTAAHGRAVSASAQLDVKARAGQTVKPAAAEGIRLSAGSGRPGDRVTVTVTVPAGADRKGAYVSSAAFAGGRVDLRKTGTHSWTGTAVVARDVRPGSYGVHAVAGGREFAAAHFDAVRFDTGRP
ncbi:hypothetical protein [Streptomyces sp. NPDC089799]|uniref:hypothetical protein n=1 Tax=Streptomyces sp. NPDC089799 TaxID=3155066 RepID=UPI00342AA2F2